MFSQQGATLALGIQGRTQPPAFLSVLEETGLYKITPYTLYTVLCQVEI